MHDDIAIQIRGDGMLIIIKCLYTYHPINQGDVIKLFDNLDLKFVQKSFNEIQVLTLKLLRYLYSVEKNRP